MVGAVAVGVVTVVVGAMLGGAAGVMVGAVVAVGGVVAWLVGNVTEGFDAVVSAGTDFTAAGGFTDEGTARAIFVERNGLAGFFAGCAPDEEADLAAAFWLAAFALDAAALAARSASNFFAANVMFS
jgi:hypothetical protein